MRRLAVVKSVSSKLCYLIELPQFASLDLSPLPRPLHKIVIAKFKLAATKKVCEFSSHCLFLTKQVRHTPAMNWRCQTRQQSSTREMAILDGHQGGHERESSIAGGHGPSPAVGGRARSSSVKTNSPFSEEKPIASGNGVYLYISLAEPALYLQGFDHGDSSNRTTAMLRGTFRLKVAKSAKIKSITLNFRGRAETEWPEGK